MPNHLESIGSTTKSLLSLFTKPTPETLVKALLLLQMVNFAKAEGMNSTIENTGSLEKPWSPSDVIGPVGMLCGSLFLYHIWNEFIAPCLSAYEERKRRSPVQEDLENSIELQSIRGLKKKMSDPALVVVVDTPKSTATPDGSAVEQEEEPLVMRQKIKK